MPTQLWTDGSCPANPGPGAWAAILVHEREDGTKVVKPMAGGVAEETTNNRMELLAVINGLKALTRHTVITVHTDSRYVMDGFDKGWVNRWVRNHWRTRGGDPVKNKDLWLDLHVLVSLHDVRWVHVKGHRGTPLNERADKLAALAVPMDKRSAQRALDLEREFDAFMLWAP